MRVCGVFPVKRGSADKTSVEKAAKLLKAGKTVAIFPQGGIVRNTGEFSAKAGAALLSTRCRVPLLPAAIYCEKRVRPFVRITVRIGTPLVAENDTMQAARKLNQQLQQAVRKLLEEGHGD